MKLIKEETVDSFAKKDRQARIDKTPRVSSQLRLQASMTAARKLYLQHLRNILNGDIKPDNAMVDFINQANLTLLDLGLARDISVVKKRQSSGNAALFFC